MITKLNAAGFNAEGFADDVVTLLIGKFEETLCSLMNSAMAIVDQWCSENGLSVNPQKTSLVLFTNKRKLNKVTLPKLSGTRLKLADHAKFLGFYLDKKLNWKKHIQERIVKATRKFWQCRSAFGKNWGLQPKVIHWLYEAIVRPILCYGCHVWHHRTKIKTIKDELEHVQRMALLGITGVMKSTPTKALEVMLSVLPIDLFIEREELTASRRR